MPSVLAYDLFDVLCGVAQRCSVLMMPVMVVLLLFAYAFLCAYSRVVQDYQVMVVPAMMVIEVFVAPSHRWSML
jgi:uncharacterized membrane protein YjdF